MRHLLYIPTHRQSTPAIASYLMEHAFVRDKLGEEIAFAVIDAVDSPFVASHTDIIRGWGETRGDARYHLTPHGTAALVGHIAAEVATTEAERLLLRKLLLVPGVSYGAGPNKAALLAAALGVDVLHRRDSDTTVTVVDGQPRYPAELEIQAVARRVGDLNTRNEVRNPDARPLVIASAYSGDPPLDRKALLQCDPELACRVERLADPGSSDEEIDESVREYFVAEPARTYVEDFFEIDRSGKTEMGVSCVDSVWRELPEMPIQDTLGGDYMQKNLMYRFRVPVVFHSRKVNHDYDESRSAQSATDAAEYALRDLRYLVLWRVWSAHNRTLQSEPSTYWSAPHTLNQQGYARSFAAAADTTPRSELEAIVDEFVAVHRSAASLATGAERVVFHEIAEQAQAHGTLIDEVYAGINDFIFLVTRWPDLITAAGDTPPALVDSLRVV